MNERQNSSSSDSRAYESVEFFITTNSKLQMARRYAFDAKIFGCIA